MSIEKITVDIKRQQSVVASLSQIRKISSFHLPIGHSFIPFDILITVVDNFYNNKELTVKSLFASLPYSDMGLRYHFRKLVDSGWIELKKSSTDSRSKHVIPTDKLFIQFELISTSLNSLLIT